MPAERSGQVIAVRFGSTGNGRSPKLELVLRMIQTIETERDAIASAKSKSQQTTSAKKIKHLVKLKSIGPEFATVLVGEVFYRTFNNRKQIGSVTTPTLRRTAGLRVPFG